MPPPADTLSAPPADSGLHIRAPTLPEPLLGLPAPRAESCGVTARKEGFEPTICPAPHAQHDETGILQWRISLTQWR